MHAEPRAARLSKINVACRSPVNGDVIWPACMRFRLRTLLVVILFVCISAAAVSHARHRVAREIEFLVPQNQLPAEVVELAFQIKGTPAYMPRKELAAVFRDAGLERATSWPSDRPFPQSYWKLPTEIPGQPAYVLTEHYSASYPFRGQTGLHTAVIRKLTCDDVLLCEPICRITAFAR